MSEGKFWTQELRKNFDRLTIIPEQVPFIKARIVNMTRRGGESVYLVIAIPEGAKVKRSADGTMLSVWPETCLGMISRNSDSSWNVYPYTRGGLEFRKRPIERATGREPAVKSLLHFWANENAKREGLEPIAPTEHPERDDLADKMFQAYMLTFDNFATDTNEVMESLDIPRTMVSMIGKRLENADLIVREKVEDHGGLRMSGGGITRSRGAGARFSPDTWQCFETYDSITRAAAIDLYIEKLPQYAKQAGDAIAEEMRETNR